MKEEKQYEPVYHVWKEKDFFADRAVIAMKPIQRHFYRSLLQAAFYATTPPNLPATDEELYILADADSLAHWKEHKEAVLAKFSRNKTEAGNEVLVHKRLVSDWQQLMESVDKHSKAGKARAAKAANQQS